MKSSKDMLTSILKTTQMGQIGIRSVLDTHVQPGMRSALESQLQEYDSIETQAREIASQRGWELDEVDPAIRAMANMTTRMRVPKKYPDSKIADMMIRGNTTGMIKSLKNLHRFNQQDPQVSAISQKLLDCETANIKQMQAFL